MIPVDKNSTEKEQLMFYYGMYCGYNGTCNFSYLEVYGQSMQIRGDCPFNVALVTVNQGNSTQSTKKISMNDSKIIRHYIYYRNEIVIL